MDKDMRKRRNQIQNAAIAALLCLMAALLWSLVSSEGVIKSSMLDTLAPPSTTQTAPPGENSSPANSAFPMNIVVRNGDETSGYLNISSSDSGFESLGTLLNEATGSAGNGATATEAQFRQALQQNSICFDLLNTLPLEIVLQWAGAENSSFVGSARYILISGTSSENAQLYTAVPEDGIYRVYTTALSFSSLYSHVSLYGANNLTFAFADSEYSSLSPYTIIPSSLPKLSDLSSINPATSSNLDALLEALDFNPRTNTRYTESNGTEVIKDSERTLSIQPNGSISYTGNGFADGMYSALDSSGNATLSAAISAAWTIAGSIPRDSSGIEALCLTGVEATENGYIVSLGYRAGGYLISCGADGTAGTFVIEDGAVAEFKMLCRSYIYLDTESSLLPLPQAMAAADGGQLLYIGYRDRENVSSATAAWLIG